MALLTDIWCPIFPSGQCSGTSQAGLGSSLGKTKDRTLPPIGSDSGVMSTLIIQLEIDYQKDFLSSLSALSIFSVHYPLWILNAQAIKVADCAYKTTGGQEGCSRDGMRHVEPGRTNESSKFSLRSLTFRLQCIILEST